MGERNDLVAELYYGGEWHTYEAYVRNPVRFTRERDPGTEPVPMSVTVTLAGYHNPKSPFSPLYGVAGQNTPIRFMLESDTRFYGEVSSWAPRRTVDYDEATGRGDAWTDVEASGILRRLGQGTDPLRSPLFRSMSGVAAGDYVPYVYWPMEDGEQATQFASGLAGGDPAVFSGDIAAAASNAGLLGSEPLPTLATASSIAFPIRQYTNTDQWVLQFALNVPTALSAETTLFTAQSPGGTVVRWQLSLDPNLVFPPALDLRIRGFSSSGSTLIDETMVAENDTEDFGFYGNWAMGMLAVYQDGSGVRARMGMASPTRDINTVSNSTTGTHSAISALSLPALGSSLNGFGLGHVAVFTDANFTIGADDLDNAAAMNGWAGEQAHERIERLCREEGIPVTVDGTASQLMGVQPRETLTAILAEIERTDDGLLYEPRDSYGLVYRCGRERYNRPVVLALDYTSGAIMPTLDVVLDDLASRNDVTVNNRDAGSARAALESGPLSVQPPPDGIGRYTTSVDVNTSTDDVLVDHANWHLHKGTIDEIRFAKVTVDFDAAPDQAAAAAAVDFDDVITISNLPSDEFTGLARLQVTGYTETIGSHSRSITYTCIPASTYDIGVWGSDAKGSRWGARTTFLAEDLTAVETGADVDTGTDVWATTASHPTRFPFNVNLGGLTYSCTAITGTHPNLTLTLVRLADDKTHTTGDQVTVTDTDPYGL